MSKTIYSHWRKSSRSNAGNCVEVADNLRGVVALRDSKDPYGACLTFTPASWAAFIAHLKAAAPTCGSPRSVEART